MPREENFDETETVRQASKPWLLKHPLRMISHGENVAPKAAKARKNYLQTLAQVAGAVTAAGAITEKYAGLGETELTKLFKGDVWTTNLIIAMVTGVATNVLYSVGASDFDAGKLTSLLWLAGLVVKLKDSPDVATLTSNPVEAAVAIVTTLLAWA